MNKIILVGNLTADAVINSVSEKQDAINFTVATNDGYRNRETGEWVDQAEFHECVEFVAKGKGEKFAALLVKGREVEVVGALKTGKPNEGKDGKTYVNKYIVAEEIKPKRLPGEKKDA